MTQASWIVDLSVVVPRDEVERYLGYGSPGAVTQRIKKRLDELWESCERMVRPRGACRAIDEDEAGRIGVPGSGSMTALGLCTIGPALELETTRLAAAGDMLDALLMDAFGSAAAETAAEALAVLIGPLGCDRGLSPRPRSSPGYGDWPVTSQEALVALLPARELGVALTPGCMMVPRKSVSFAIRFEEGSGGAGRTGRACSTCALTTCPYRARRGAAPTRAGSLQ
ncbi:MAG: hypothetical protein HY815_03740 [Candidatus Riflebacteria bacterium]|nr:hypothetical protein [Candidatus Riflebacteria bacterium]